MILDFQTNDYNPANNKSVSNTVFRVQIETSTNFKEFDHETVFDMTTNVQIKAHLKKKLAKLSFAILS